MDYGAVSIQEDGAVLLRSGDSPRMLQGLDLLLQRVVMELCSDPSRSMGGSGFVSALREIPLGDSSADQTLNERLQRAEQNILTGQQDSALEDDERLRSLSLLAVREGNDGREADIFLEAVSGDTITRTLS